MRRSTYLILLSIVVLLSACKSYRAPEEVILAKVGAEVLTLSDARDEIPAHIFEADSTNAITKFRDNWIRREVILQEADRLNLASQPNFTKKLKRIQEEFILQEVQDYIIKEFEDNSEVSEMEARNYYQQNKDKFTLEERYVRYRHIIAKSNADAESAKRDLMRGNPWEGVAREYSMNADLKIRESERYWPISIAGGDISLLNRYLNIIGPSEISPTVRSGNEYHFVQLLDERPEGDHPELDWLIDQIKQWLTLEKRKRAFNTYVKNLYLQGQANNEIEIYNVTNETNTAVIDTASSNNLTNEE